MRLFAGHYPNGEFGQALPDQLTRTHQVVLIQLIAPENIHIKQRHAEQAVTHGWGYRQRMQVCLYQIRVSFIFVDLSFSTAFYTL